MIGESIVQKQTGKSTIKKEASFLLDFAEQQ